MHLLLEVWLGTYNGEDVSFTCIQEFNDCSATKQFLDKVSMMM